MNDLPNLTKKQQAFVMRYVDATEAYKFAYDSNMKEEYVNSEASKLLKNHKVTQWIEYYKNNVKKVCEEEVIYTAKNAFEELNNLQKRCSQSSKTYAVEKSCIDTKCKIAGLFNETTLSQAVTVNMGTVKFDEKEVLLDIGEDLS